MHYSTESEGLEVLKSFSDGGKNKMWVSRRLFNRLEERVSALERKEQERIELEKYREEHGDEIIEEAKKLLRFGGR